MPAMATVVKRWSVAAGIAVLGAAPLAAIPRLVGAAEPRSKYAVAAQDEATARAVIETLEQGGSAVDAAIAGSAMLGVTASVSCGLGGGGLTLVYDAGQKKTFAFDYRETAPAAYTLDTYRSKAAGAPIGVPGEVAGLVELHSRWGKRTFADDLAPAARAAENGFAVTKHMADSIASHAKLFLGVPYGSVFAPRDVLAKAHEKVSHPALGATLRRIGAEGKKAFYEGPVAAEIVEVAQKAGSPLAASDLASYHVIDREPLRKSWEGYDVVTMPPPSGGGIILLETLGVYSKAELVNMGFGTAGYVHMLAEAMRGAIADRLRTVGDPAFTPDRSAELLAPDRLRARRARIASDRTHVPERFPLVEPGTSALVVGDAKGNVVALTTTVNNPFGSGVYAPRSGVLLNDELSDFTDPATAMRFGAAPGPNAPRGGARPSSSMTPTIVLRDGVPEVVLGGSGGARIPVNVVQVLLCRLTFNKALDACVAAPRFWPQNIGPTLAYNIDQLPAIPVQLDLIDRGEQLKLLTYDDVSAVQIVAFERTNGGDPRLFAAADPRKGGVALVR
jgi:gamma-glutamyltranspeptidase/glutathione hydrolase